MISWAETWVELLGSQANVLQEIVGRVQKVSQELVRVVYLCWPKLEEIDLKLVVEQLSLFPP